MKWMVPSDVRNATPTWDVTYEINGKFDGLVAIPLGAFEDPFSLEPRFSVWERRKCDWVEISSDLKHSH